MAENTNISWATHTWNPWVGCDKVSPACDHCYAEAWAKRAGSPELWAGDRRRTKTWGDPPRYNKAALASGRRDSIFACSLADWFDNHPDVAPIRADAWIVVRANQAVDWYLVTKRIPNVLKMLPPDCSKENYRHVVIIITVVNQEEADRDIPRLVALKSKFPWLRVGLSIEPMLGPIDLEYPKTLWPDGPPMCCDGRECGCMGRPIEPPLIWKLDWVIVGGESGGHARPISPAWVRSVRDVCAGADVPFHFKQWGEFAPGEIAGDFLKPTRGYTGKSYWDGRWNDVYSAPEGHVDDEPEVYRIGVTKAGRTLDGCIHDDGPPLVAA